MSSWVLLFLFWIAAIAWFIYVIRRLRRHLLFFQIEEYYNRRFAILLWRNWRRVLLPTEIGLVLILIGLNVLASVFLPQASPAWPCATFCVLWATLYIGLVVLRKVPSTKKSLVLTARATRILITGYVLTFGLFVLMVWFVSGWPFGWQVDLPSARKLLWIALGALVLSELVGLVVIAANVVMYPVEASFRSYYVRSAKRIFGRFPALRVVAVTGSYGKTSTKEIIAHVLSKRYRVLKTPRSFNTVMGICKVIREQLKPEHEVFVVEMGAYKKGEIARLCKLTPPHIGVLTAIGPQHLERFKTVEQVAEAKYELMSALPEDGIGIFNGDDPFCRRLAERPASFATRLYGFEPLDRPLDVWAANVTVTERGTEFDVSTTHGETVRFVTRLLGQHNVFNILAAAVVGMESGLNLQEVADAVTDLEPVEHRLQRIDGTGGVVVIDDAYNANPAGVRAALEVLGGFPGGRKILITPGMVELGNEEAREHRQMGLLAAEVCDYVILVGPTRTQPIAEGLCAKNFPTERLVVVQDLDEATRCLQTIVRPGDVVLFENDLPDTYAVDTLYF